MSKDYDIRTFKKKTLKLDETIHSKVYAATYIYSTVSYIETKVPEPDISDWYESAYYQSFQQASKNKIVKHKKTVHTYLLENKIDDSTSTFVGSLLKLLIFLHNADLDYYYKLDKLNFVKNK